MILNSFKDDCKHGRGSMIEWDKKLREKSYSKEELKEVGQLFKISQIIL